jgi:excisionase family DNA binding protein
MNHYNQKLVIEFDEKQSQDFLNLLESINLYLSNKQLGAKTPKRFLNIQETSKYLGIPKNTLYQYTSQRKIPFVKVGKQLIFDAEELSKWISDLKKEVI